MAVRRRRRAIGVTAGKRQSSKRNIRRAQMSRIRRKEPRQVGRVRPVRKRSYRR